MIAGGDAHVMLDVIHHDFVENTVAREFERLLFVEHKLTVANTKCPRRTRARHALDLMVHSPGINTMNLFVHDGLEYRCGGSRCGPIAGSVLF